MTFGVALAAVVLRLGGVTFAVLSVTTRIGYFAHVWALPLAGLAAAAQLASLGHVALRRRSLHRTGLALTDLALTAVILGVALAAAGPAGRMSGLDGLFPYVVTNAAVLAAAYTFSWPGLVGDAALVALWAFALAQGVRRPSPAGDLAGIVFWYVMFGLMVVVLRYLAERSDDAQRRQIGANAELAAVYTRLHHLQSTHHHVLSNVIRELEGVDGPAPASALKSRLEGILQRARSDLEADGPRRAATLGSLVADAEQTASLLGVSVVYENGPENDIIVAGDPPGGVCDAVFGVLPGLLLNVRRHSGEQTAYLRVYADQAHLAVSVRDSGRGFDAAAAAWSEETARSRQRLADAGAAWRVESAPGEGTTWTIEWPAAPPLLPGYPTSSSSSVNRSGCW